MTANDLHEARALYDAATPVLTVAQVDDLRPGLDLPPHEREWYRRGDLIALCNSHEALRAALDIERGISKSALDECASLRTRLVDVERESDEARVERDAERQESRRTRLDVEACCIKRDELEQERDAALADAAALRGALREVLDEPAVPDWQPPDDTSIPKVRDVIDDELSARATALSAGPKEGATSPAPPSPPCARRRRTGRKGIGRCRSHELPAKAGSLPLG